MRIILETTWEKLQRLIAENHQLRARVAKLESTIQELTLSAGIAGFEIRTKAAQPERIVLHQVRSHTAISARER